MLEPRKAIDCINRLRDQHENLYERLRKLLGQKDDVAIMNGIRCILASLHCEHPQYKVVYDELKSEASVAGYFEKLMGSLSYLEFNGLLDELIHRYGDQELKEDAESYRNDLLTFLGHTTIKQAANPQQPWWLIYLSITTTSFTACGGGMPSYRGWWLLQCMMHCIDHRWFL